MTIQCKLNENVLEVTIAREEVLNALDLEHLRDLENALDRAGEDGAVRTVLLRGSGRAFCVGADIKAMDQMHDDEFTEATAHYQSLCRKARALDKAIIAALNGYALGGGLEIALIADLRIAARSAQLGLPDAELGFSPSGGLTYLLNRIVGAGRALHLLLTCEMLSAEQALDFGLVTRVVDDAELDTEAIALARQIAAYPPTGIRNIKRAMNAALENDLETTLALEAELDHEAYQSDETRASLRAFLESRRKKD